MYRNLTFKRLKSVKNKINLPTKPPMNSTTGEFKQTFKEEISSIFLKIFQKLKTMRNSETHTMKQHYPITKVRKRYSRKVQTSVPSEYRYKTQGNGGGGAPLGLLLRANSNRILLRPVGLTIGKSVIRN